MQEQNFLKLQNSDEHRPNTSPQLHSTSVPLQLHVSCGADLSCFPLVPCIHCCCSKRGGKGSAVWPVAIATPRRVQTFVYTGSLTKSTFLRHNFFNYLDILILDPISGPWRSTTCFSTYSEAGAVVRALVPARNRLRGHAPPDVKPTFRSVSSHRNRHEAFLEHPPTESIYSPIPVLIEYSTSTSILCKTPTTPFRRTYTLPCRTTSPIRRIPFCHISMRSDE
jgi:hypothetical protein